MKKYIIMFLAFCLAFLAIGCARSYYSVCGDGICDYDEHNLASCPLDCCNNTVVCETSEIEINCFNDCSLKQKFPNWFDGAAGLNTYLIEGMPPPVIHDAGTYPFAVGITIENQGQIDIGPGTDNPFVMVRLEGINPEQFNMFNMTESGLRKVLPDSIHGPKRNLNGTISSGEITTVIFQPFIYMPNIQGHLQFTIRTDVCYDYETFAAAQICIKDDILENIPSSRICSLTGEKHPQNSGGPLQVSSVVENPLSQNKIQVDFVIENVGTGEFFGRPAEGDDLTEICNFSSSNFNKYFVDVEVEPISDSGWIISCSRFDGSNRGRIKLYQGNPTTVSCAIERTRPSAGRIFQDWFNVRLKYRYGQFIETPIIIQDVTN